LHGIYRWFENEVPIQDLINSVPFLPEGGTLAVQLALNALARGYRTELYSLNLNVLDPTWFTGDREFLASKLSESRKVRRSAKVCFELAALENFVRKGGRLMMKAITRSLLRKHLNRGEPMLTGLSVTFLYGESREVPSTGKPDDLGGKPEGHFVVLHGYDHLTKMVTIHDPYPHLHVGEDNSYSVHIDRLINAILLGVLTHDANILVIHK
jgi:hypothetical protein